MEIVYIKAMRLILLIIAACLFYNVDIYSCTSAIVSGEKTKNGRPLLWKHRDTDEENNVIDRIAATSHTFEYVALYNASDSMRREAWMGFNSKGFAIMNTAVYNLKNDTVTEMDKEGLVMTEALKYCVTVDDFENMLKSMPKPLGVEANFGVIDAFGNGAYFETSNYEYVKFDLKDSATGVLTRTNYAYSGRIDEGKGYIREQNELALLESHVDACDVTPELFTETLSRSFYHSLINKDFTHSGEKWLVDQDFIPRYSSTATIVIEGVLPGENPLLTTMWVGLGYPPCSEINAVWLDNNGIPDGLKGNSYDGHAPLCDSALMRKNEVFSIRRGSGSHYLDLNKLYNAEDSGYCQVLLKKNREAYKRGYEILEGKRKDLLK